MPDQRHDPWDDPPFSVQSTPMERLAKLEERVNGFRQLFLQANEDIDKRLADVEKTLTWAIRIFVTSSLAIIGTLITMIASLPKK